VHVIGTRLALDSGGLLEKLGAPYGSNTAFFFMDNQYIRIANTVAYRTVYRTFSMVFGFFAQRLAHSA
jgi:hypothetical protein